MDKTVAIIQARMGSTRLPEKVLMDIGTEPMMWHVYDRASRASLIDSIVLATTRNSQDDAIVELCETKGINYFRGSEEDVLDRYYQSASQEDADVVVRLTADCPFLSPPVIDRVIRRYQTTSAEYVSNTIEYTHPDGLDVEVFGLDALEQSWERTMDPEEREHVTIDLRESGDFETENVENVLDLSKYEFTDEETVLRWTVDYPADIEFVGEVYDRLTERGHWVFDQQAVLELLAREPELQTINEDR